MPKINTRFEARTLSGETVIDLYDEIGMYGVSAAAFKQALDGVTTPRLILNINSPGGDVFDGVAMYNNLLDYNGEVVVRVTGLAASAASIIAMAGDKIEIADNAFIMIHNAWSIAVGDARAMSDLAKTLSKIDAQLAKTYAKRTGLDADDIADMMNAETWLDSGDAVERGFADSVIDAGDGQDAANFDLANFSNVPKALKDKSPKRSAKSDSKPAPAVDLSPLSASLSDLLRAMAT